MRTVLSSTLVTTGIVLPRIGRRLAIQATIAAQAQAALGLVGDAGVLRQLAVQAQVHA